MPHAELEEGPNLFYFVRNNPINKTDALGLICCEPEREALMDDIEEGQRAFDKLARDHYCPNVIEGFLYGRAAKLIISKGAGIAIGLFCAAEDLDDLATSAAVFLKVVLAKENYNQCMADCNKPNCNQK